MGVAKNSQELMGGSLQRTHHCCVHSTQQNQQQHWKCHNGSIPSNTYCRSVTIRHQCFSGVSQGKMGHGKIGKDMGKMEH